MTQPYAAFVHGLARQIKEARALPLGEGPRPVAPPLSADAPRVLVFSPHPDDESITAALPLRLRREAGCAVSVVAVTQGSREDRQLARFEEMGEACGHLGFGLIPTGPRGLMNINPISREARPGPWARAVATIREILVAQDPVLLFMPHDQDWNITHIGTHLLVQDALRTMDPGFRCRVVETEYWRAMARPNLMVEVSPEHVADLVAAIALHKGEVVRNPYHLTLPAWLMDNVRRGGEIVGGQGGAVPDFLFAALYRVRDWAEGGFVPGEQPGRMLAVGQDLAELLP